MTRKYIGKQEYIIAFLEVFDLSEDNIMVSICCLAYNHEKYIRQCLDGFLMQKTTFKYEVLIHDDASTDSTADIIREYEAKYPDIIKPIYQTENQYSKGVRMSYTYQYSRAKGKYIAMCEGDDYWIDENKLQKQFDALESNPSCKMCVCKIKDVSYSGDFLGFYHPGREIESGKIEAERFLDVFEKGSFQTSGYFFCFVKELTLEYMPEYTRVATVGDIPLVMLFATYGDFVYLDDVMSCYRHNPNGYCQTSIRNDNEEVLMKKIEKDKKMYESFDLCTNNKFHNYCIRESKRIEFLTYYRMKKFKLLLKKDYSDFFSNLSNKERLFIILNAYLPHGMNLYQKVKVKIINEQ